MISAKVFKGWIGFTFWYEIFFYFFFKLGGGLFEVLGVEMEKGV